MTRSAVTAPLKVLGVVVVVLISITKAKTHRRQDRRRYRKIAYDLGIGRGKILSREFSWNTERAELRIVSLLPGDWNDLLAEVAAAANSAGYLGVSAANTRRMERPPRQIKYRVRAGQPMPDLVFSLFASGDKIRGSAETIVPANQTGIELSLAGRSSG